jgi:hypothetical protein
MQSLQDTLEVLSTLDPVRDADYRAELLEEVRHAKWSLSRALVSMRDDTLLSSASASSDRSGGGGGDGDASSCIANPRMRSRAQQRMQLRAQMRSAEEDEMPLSSARSGVMQQAAGSSYDAAMNINTVLFRNGVFNEQGAHLGSAEANLLNYDRSVKPGVKPVAPSPWTGVSHKYASW